MAVFRKRTHTPTPKKKDIPAGLWTKCPLDGEMVYTKDLEANWNVFPISGYHERLSTRRRIAAADRRGHLEGRPMSAWSPRTRSSSPPAVPTRSASPSTRRSRVSVIPSSAATA
jgi:hypothetical protein